MYTKQTTEIPSEYFGGGKNLTPGNVTDTTIGSLEDILNNVNADLEGLQIPVSEVGVKQSFIVDDAGGSSNNTDVAIPAGVVIKVLDAKVINKAAGTASDTVQVQKYPSGGPAENITDAIDISGGDKTIARAGEIDDAAYSLSGDDGDSLRVAVTDGGGSDVPATTTVVEFVRIS